MGNIQKVTFESEIFEIDFESPEVKKIAADLFGPNYSIAELSGSKTFKRMVASFRKRKLVAK